MATSSAYGERPPLQGYRRSFTAPHRQLSYHERAALDKSDADSGVVYQHPHVRIISFAPPNESIVSRNSETHADADYPIDTIETLPWRSRTEDLTAAGPMRIEKVQGSVNFLKCGHNFVHSILRNSQCWCVDGESKFVLRKRKLEYYRIELPKETAEDRAKVEELKTVLATVLKFEKTPCPFKRAFQVELPDDAITPRRKGKWKARDSSLLSSPDLNTPSVRKWKSSRPSMPYTPPSAFPDSFNKRRTSDFIPDSPITPMSAPVQRRSSVAERRAAFEHMQSSSRPSSRPPSRPQTPTSTSSGHSFEDDGTSDRDHCTEETDPIREYAEVEDDESHPLSGDVRVPSPLVHETSLHMDDGVEPEKEEGLEPIPPAEQIDEASLPEHHEEVALDESLAAAANIQSATLDEVARDEGTTNGDEPLADTEPIASAPNEDLQEATMDKEPVAVGEEADPVVLNNTDTEVPSTEPEASALDDTASIASTADSFHSTDDIPDHIPDVDPTPLAHDHDPFAAKQYSHKRDISELTVTASTFSEHGDSDPPVTPRLIQSSMSDQSWPDVQTPSSPLQDGLRQRQKGGRSLSPMPSSNILASSTSDQRQPSPSRFSAAVIQKAATIAVTKPLEVVVLVVQILARIAGGATLNDLLNGGLFQQSPQRTTRNQRHNRDTSFPDRIAAQSDDEEDDFGVPIRIRTRSWEQRGVPQGGFVPVKEGREREKEDDVDSLFADDLD
jgi:hypothetical protein